jgi:hypothetical protein
MSDSKGKPDDEDWVLASSSADSKVIGRVPPFTRDDLDRALRIVCPPDMAEEIISELGSTGGGTRPGERWDNDILLTIAQFSIAHADRIREYLGWSQAQMQSEIAKLRD